MRSLGRLLGIVLIVVATCVAVLLAAASTALPHDRLALAVDGETVSLAGLHGWELLVGLVAAVAAVVLAMIVALCAISLGLLAGLFGIFIGLLASVASIALVVAPFALVGWAVWRLVRRRPHDAVAAPRVAVTSAP